MTRCKKPLLVVITLLGGVLAFLLVHRLFSGDETLLIPVANRIDLGVSEHVVAKIAANEPKLTHRRIEHWSIFTTGLLSEWMLFVHYTNNVVDFVGVVDSDRRTIRPKDAPLWKGSEFFSFEDAIRQGIPRPSSNSTAMTNAGAPP